MTLLHPKQSGILIRWGDLKINIPFSFIVSHSIAYCVWSNVGNFLINSRLNRHQNYNLSIKIIFFLHFYTSFYYGKKKFWAAYIFFILFDCIFCTKKIEIMKHVWCWFFELQIVPAMVMSMFGNTPGMPGLFIASLFSASLR